MADFYNKLAALSKDKKMIMATIIAGEDRLLAAKAIWSEGSYIEQDERAAAVWIKISDKLNDIKKPTLIKADDTLVFAESTGGNPNLIICGGGHISIPVVKIGKMLDFQVTVIDDRLAFASPERFPEANQVLCEDFSKALASIPDSTANYYVIVTRGHRYDQTCLREIIERPHAYIGMIGSKSRVGLVKDAMIEDGVAKELVDTVHTPIGLKIGAETPEEIAVSIMAELIQEKNQKIAWGGMSKEIMSAILDKGLADTPKALVTIVKRLGSAPRQAGTKMLVLPTGDCIGTIGGGCVEAEVRRQALITLDDGKCRSLTVDMTGKDAEDEGMVCGGIVDVFVELIK
ncbi:MAG: XdhC family protein [Clostridia bacterium]|nr:XdhC family protein [Clostridia bacterium]MDD4571685.1 XdhC family protein [Clostridia bacterium]